MCIYIYTYIFVTKEAHPGSIAPSVPSFPRRAEQASATGKKSRASTALWETWKPWKQVETSDLLEISTRIHLHHFTSSLHGAQPTTWQGRSRRKRCRLSGTAKGRPVTRHAASSPMAGPNLKPSPAKPQTYDDLQVTNCLWTWDDDLQQVLQISKLYYKYVKI